MHNPKISVIIATHNKGSLLRRSLQTYTQQSFKEFEIILLDDDSTDPRGTNCEGTWRIAEYYRQDLDLTYVRLKRKSEEKEFLRMWKVIQQGVALAQGEMIVIAEPQLMLGIGSLEEIWRNRKTKAVITCGVFCLTEEAQKSLDLVDWFCKGVGELEKLPQSGGWYTGDRVPTKDHILALLTEDWSGLLQDHSSTHLILLEDPKSDCARQFVSLLEDDTTSDAPIPDLCSFL